MTDAWSITDGYWDVDGEWHPTPPETQDALRSAMGGDDLDVPPDPDPMWFVRAGEQHSLWNACDLILEDGAVLHSVWDLPPDLPLGYHELRPLDGTTSTWLVVTPGRCPVPERAWGWAVQLYAMRSEQSWGIGDLVDLRDLARWSAGMGANVAMISPLHAAPPSPYHDPSPYFATSRIYRNVLYLRIEDLPGAEALAELPRLVAEGRALNDRSTIDRGDAYRLKMTALNELFEQFMAGTVDHDAFATWRGREGTPLQTFATYCALAEILGIDHGRWPAEYRHPGASAVRRFAEEHEPRVRFHEWCQWQVYGQLAAAGCGRARPDQRRRGRLRPERRRQLGLPGPPRAGLPDRGATRRVQRPRPGVGAPAVRALEAPGRALRAADPHAALVVRALRGHPDRPCHGSVPPVLDPSGRRPDRGGLRPLRRRRGARPRRPRGRTGRRFRGG